MERGIFTHFGIIIFISFMDTFVVGVFLFLFLISGKLFSQDISISTYVTRPISGSLKILASVSTNGELELLRPSL